MSQALQVVTPTSFAVAGGQLASLGTKACKEQWGVEPCDKKHQDISKHLSAKQHITAGTLAQVSVGLLKDCEYRCVVEAVTKRLLLLVASWQIWGFCIEPFDQGQRISELLQTEQHITNKLHAVTVCCPLGLRVSKRVTAMSKACSCL